MNIDQVNHASGMVVGGEFLTYDSPKCMLRHIESLPKSFVIRDSDIYLADYNTSALVSADSLVMVLTNHVPTVMNGQVVCFSSTDAADSFSAYDDEVVTDWIGFQTLRGNPDLIVEASLSPVGMQPDLIEAEKGNLLLLRLAYEPELAGKVLSVRGYSNMAALTLPDADEMVEIRLLLTLPGAGFPIVDETGFSYGMIRVAGAHTDEEGQL